ncbi:uncharacterized protein [Haliotis asinina]|uniref:uncharacterized protein n=1 Tax=Haliotis asinina TaxID=109174 RepID=UPI003531FF00
MTVINSSPKELAFHTHQPFSVSYFVSDVQTNQTAAQAVCATSGYRLATIRDAETMRFIEDFLLDNIVSGNYTDAWIALEFDVFSGQFKWPNGDVADYTDWTGVSYEPDQMYGGEICVRLSWLPTNVYTWRTTKCTDDLFPLCERCISNYIDVVPSLDYTDMTLLAVVDAASPIECAARCMELDLCDRMTYNDQQCSIYSYNIATCSTTQLKIGI